MHRPHINPYPSTIKFINIDNLEENIIRLAIVRKGCYEDNFRVLGETVNGLEDNKQSDFLRGLSLAYRYNNAYHQNKIEGNNLFRAIHNNDYRTSNHYIRFEIDSLLVAMETFNMLDAQTKEEIMSFYSWGMSSTMVPDSPSEALLVYIKGNLYLKGNISVPRGLQINPLYSFARHDIYYYNVHDVYNNPICNVNVFASKLPYIIINDNVNVRGLTVEEKENIIKTNKNVIKEMLPSLWKSFEKV